MRPRSLRARIVALCVVLVSASIGSTAWIVSLSASDSIRQEYSQNIAADAAIYNALLGYAATHSSWAGAAPMVRSLASEAHQITVTTTTGAVLLSSSPDASAPAPTAVPAATIDPLAPDSGLSRTPQRAGIDARVAGPFTLPAADAARISKAVDAVARCVQARTGARVPTATYPNGRKHLVGHLAVKACLAPPTPTGAVAPGGPDTGTSFGALLERATSTETAAADRLTALFTHCLAGIGEGLPADYPKTDWVNFLGRLDALPMTAGADTCLTTARRTQLAGYVAPPALLFLSGDTTTPRHPRLTAAGARRIALLAAVVLLVAVVAALLATGTVTRPLHALTTAADRIRRGERHARIPTSGATEIAVLAGTLNQMTAELVAAEDRRRELISDVAHELRTPLGNVRGWLEAVQDGLARPDRALIASLLEESRLLQSTIDDLQDLALADADRLVVHPEPLDVADVVEQVAAAQRAGATAKGLTVRVVTDGDLRLGADPRRLRQAIGNLVANAIRYTDRGGVTITAEGSATDVVVTVVDTGVGISEQDVPHAFDRFWRAEKSRDRRQGGSGLGLAITRHLVRAHGGSIELSSTLGVGTRVSVRLPRRE